MPSYRGLNLDIPPTEDEYRGYFEAAGHQHLVVQRCDTCHLLRTTMGAACPFCSSLEWTWHPVGGNGTIYSYGVVCHAVHPAFADWVPYILVVVELDEQRNEPWGPDGTRTTVSLRLLTNLVSPYDHERPELEGNVEIGRRVRACFVPIGAGLGVVQFHLTGEAQPRSARTRRPHRRTSFRLSLRRAPQ